MSKSTESTICTCGRIHPSGSVCDRRTPPSRPVSATVGEGCECGSHEHSQESTSEETCEEPHDPEHGQSHCCGLDHDHEDRRDQKGNHGQGHNEKHDHGACCSHAQAEPVDLSAVGEASATRAIYRITNMDCPMEEALIRKKLGGIAGITGLEFNLMQRVLTVNHELQSTEPIEAALVSIDMHPEPIGRKSGVSTLFFRHGHGLPHRRRADKKAAHGHEGRVGSGIQPDAAHAQSAS